MSILTDNSLQAAGIAFLFGDATLYAAGHGGKRPLESAAAGLWLAGGLACARYGSPDANKRLELLSHRTGDYLKSRHITIPDSPDTASLMRKGGLFETIEHFLFTNPSQVLNTGYALGGALFSASGIMKNNKWDVLSGALVTAGALAGLLIREKKPDPAHPPHGAVEKAVSWVQEHPLAVSAGFFGATDIALISSALKERRDHPGSNNYLLKLLTAASYIFGNGMLALSSKDQGGSDKEKNAILEKLVDRTARVISAQAPELREALVKQIAAYLAEQPEIKRNAGDIEKLLHSRLAQVNRTANANGWVARVQPDLAVPPSR